MNGNHNYDRSYRSCKLLKKFLKNCFFFTTFSASYWHSSGSDHVAFFSNYKIATFLDLKMTTKEGQFSSKLYNKKGGFNFSVARIQWKDSKISSKMF